MKKFLFFAGIGVGFVLGSCAGRAPYGELEAKARALRGKPAVWQAVDQVSRVVKDQAVAAKDKVAEKLPSEMVNGSGRQA